MAVKPAAKTALKKTVVGPRVAEPVPAPLVVQSAPVEVLRKKRQPSQAERMLTELLDDVGHTLSNVYNVSTAAFASLAADLGRTTRVVTVRAALTACLLLLGFTVGRVYAVCTVH